MLGSPRQEGLVAQRVVILVLVRFGAGVGIVAGVALARYSLARPTPFASFDSPDGRLRLVVWDGDPKGSQVTAVFSIHDRVTGRPLSSQRYRLYCDSEQPVIGSVTWTEDTVTVDQFALRGRVTHVGQSWAFVPRAVTQPATAGARLSE